MSLINEYLNFLCHVRWENATPTHEKMPQHELKCYFLANKGCTIDMLGFLV